MRGAGPLPARPRRTSFSIQFAVILGLLGLLIAAATAAIPLTQSASATRNSALVRASDKAEIAANLIDVQSAALSQYVVGVAQQLSSSGAQALDQAQDTARRGSKLISSADMLGLLTPSGNVIAQGGNLLDIGVSPQNDIITAVEQARTIDRPAGSAPLLLAQAPVPPPAGTPPGRFPTVIVFVARPLDSATVTLLAGDVASSSDPAYIALAERGFYVVDGSVAGHRVHAGEPVPHDLVPVLDSSTAPRVISVDGHDVAAASHPVFNNLRLLVTTGVPAVSDLVGTVLGPVGLTAVAMILIALVIVYFIVDRSLARPLRRLDRAVGALAREEFDVPVPTGTEDEIGRLGTSFDVMRQELRATIRGAEARAEIAAELNTPQPLPAALSAVCARLRATTGAGRALIAVAGSAMTDAFAASDGLNRKPDASALLAGGGPIASVLRNEASGPLLACSLDGTVEAKLGMRTVCAAPMRIGQRVLGVVAIADKPGSFIPADADLVLASAEQVSLALERAHVLALAQRQAITDELTGLYNYRFLVDYLDQQIALAERLVAPLAVLMLDIDRFKLLNDEFGHHAGDVALKLFAQTLLGSIRRSDLAARYGGEEFCVVMANTSRDEARLVAEKIRAAVANINLHVENGHAPIHFTVSIGGVAYPDDTGSASQLLQHADAALYRAKHTGRDRVCFANDGPRRARLRRAAVSAGGLEDGDDDLGDRSEE